MRTTAKGKAVSEFQGTLSGLVGSFRRFPLFDAWGDVKVDEEWYVCS